MKIGFASISHIKCVLLQRDPACQPTTQGEIRVERASHIADLNERLGGISQNHPKWNRLHESPWRTTSWRDTLLPRHLPGLAWYRGRHRCWDRLLLSRREHLSEHDRTDQEGTSGGNYKSEGSSCLPRACSPFSATHV